MKKVLILTASFGEGHNAAARNVRDAIELISDEAQVEVLDQFDLVSRRFRSVLRGERIDGPSPHQSWGSG